MTTVSHKVGAGGFGGSRCDELDSGRDQYFNSAALVLHRHKHALQSSGVFPGAIATLGHTQSFNAEDAESFAEAAEAKPEYFLCVPLRKTLRPLRLSWKLIHCASSLVVPSSQGTGRQGQYLPPSQ